MATLPVPRWFWLLALGAFLYQLPFVLLGEQRDAGELLIAAQQLLRGQPVYSSGYMPKTPGVPYLLAGAFVLFGPHLLVARAAVVAANLLGAWLVGCLARAQGWGGRTAFLAGVLYLFAAPQQEGAQILTEPFLVPLAVLAAFALLRCLQTRRLAWAVLGGAAVAGAIWIKQVGVLVLPPLGILLAVVFLRDGGRRGWIVLAAVVFLVSCIATLGVLVWTAVRPDNREAFWNCVVVGLLTRTQGGLLEIAPLAGVGANPGIWVPALLLATLVLVRRPAEPGGNGPFWLTGGLMLFSLLPVIHRNFPHYYLPALPFAAILAAVFWDATGRRLEQHRALFALLLLGGLVLPIYRLWQAAEQLRQGATVFRDLQVGRELRELIGDRRVFVLGYDPQYYFLLHAAPPTPHLYLYEENLRLADPRSPDDWGQLIRSALADVAQNRNIDYILLFGGDYDAWRYWPDEQRDAWTVCASFPIWLYETHSYVRVELRVLRRRDRDAGS
jgi:4-amino-4-deoxy-L-arabinose transferase-like glycosyltransferase